MRAENPTGRSASRNLDSLRELRARVQRLGSSVVEDLKPFLRADARSFRRLPDSDNEKKDISVATTSSVLMALSLVGKLREIYADGALREAVDLMMKSAWDSSSLPSDNAFTRAILLRTLGMLVEHKALARTDVEGLHKHELSARERVSKVFDLLPRDEPFAAVTAEVLPLLDKLPEEREQLTVEEIVRRLSCDLPRSLGVLQYPATPMLGYWFVTGVQHLCIEIGAEAWQRLARWARDSVAKQIGLIASKHEARMDPVAMAMAACLASRLHKLALDEASSAPASLVDDLPTREELRTAVRLLFEQQGISGIWPKYFPLFHYPSAGANYCFSFELLEAVLHELVDTEFLLEPSVLEGFKKAVSWCEANRLEHRYGDNSYRGWNSGGEIKTLESGIPESWATAVVHMFASELEAALNRTITTLVLRKYQATKPLKADASRLDKFIDINVALQGDLPATVKTILIEEIIQPAEEAARARTFRLRNRWSALLFGPPGTSKTSLVKGVAERLGWPYVEINPSDFLKRGLERIPIQADEVFADLMDLSKAVVLFDEMDAIVKRREQKDLEEQWQLDPTSELLTTSMLPKLAQLHDKKQVIFFFATNHRDALDSAITRPGRFDIWLCMGPPSWSEKLKNINTILDRFGVHDDVAARAAEHLAKFTSKEEGWEKHAKHLDYFTFAEVQSFMEFLCRTAKKPIREIDAALEQLQGEAVRNSINEWYGTSIMLREDSKIRKDYNLDVKETKLQ